jgi:hypothetical protein
MNADLRTTIAMILLVLAALTGLGYIGYDMASFSTCVDAHRADCPDPGAPFRVPGDRDQW